MKLLFFIVSIMLFQVSFSQKTKKSKINELEFCNYKILITNLKQLKFSKAEVYNFNCKSTNKDMPDYKLVDSNKMTATSAKKVCELTGKEKITLLKVLTNSKNYMSRIPESKGCYNPRMGFIFYNATNKIVGHFDICLECNQILFENFLNNYKCQLDFYEEGKKKFKSLCNYYKVGCCEK